MKKRCLALVLALTLVCGLVPAAAAEELLIAPAPTRVTVTIADKGEMVMARREVFVADFDEDGTLTVSDALYAAHEAAYPGGAAAGYGASMQEYGLAITKLWGDDAAVCGYWRNDASCWSLADPVESGDNVVAFNYADVAGWSDSYARFTEKQVSAVEGEPVLLTLEKAGYDENWNTVFAAVTGAEFSGAGEYTVVDKGDGAYAVTFAASGTYVLTASVADGSIVPAVVEVTVDCFDDIAGHAAEDAIRYVHDNGIMNGVGGGRFDPDATLSRAMVATVLWRLAGEPAPAGSGFDDVAAGKWYTDAILWASGTGLVTGYGDGCFGPADDITREQLVTMLWRYARYQNRDVSVGEDTNILSYEDAFDIHEYAYPAFQWACGAGLTGDGTHLEPREAVTRGETAQLLQAFLVWAE